MFDPEHIFSEIASGRICPIRFALNAWQNDLASGEKLYAEVHPLGFVKIELTPLVRGSSVSLHIWNRAARTPIHSHHFDMESYVFRGQLLDIEYHAPSASEGPAKQGDTLNMLEVRYSDKEVQRSFHKKPETFQAAPKTARLIGGTVYKVPKARFHSTRTMMEHSRSVLIRRNVGANGSACLVPHDKNLLSMKEIPLGSQDVVNILKKEISHSV